MHTALLEEMCNYVTAFESFMCGLPYECLVFWSSCRVTSHKATGPTTWLVVYPSLWQAANIPLGAKSSSV